MQLFVGIHFREPACLLAALLTLSPALAPAQACVETASTVSPLGGATGCSTCDNNLLPGSQAPSPLSAYTVHSDMPERFCSTGVLYSTEPILAPDSSGSPSLAMRTQVNDGSFTALNQTFDTFLFHTVSGCSGGGVRRIVLYAKNIGSNSVTLTPKQNIITDGAIGTVHEMETNLGTRVLSDTWDTPVGAQAIPAGGGAIIAYSKQFNASSNGSDTSANTNCFGFVRTAVSGTNPSVRLYVVAIDGAAISENKMRAEALLNIAATSGETISLDTQPSDATCENRRATGVFDSFVWRNDATTIDADALPASGISYQMALSSLSSSACSAAKQTGDMALRPPFVRGDSVGNFMVEYRVTFRLINKDPNLRRGFDVTFGKSGADMGLAWKVATGTTTPSDATVDAATTRSAWAGPNQSALTKSFLASDGGPIVLNPCEAREVAVRFAILGNSSLPFQVNVVPYDPPEYIIDNGTAQCTTVGSWATSANAGFYGTNSLVKAGGTGSATVTWTPNLNQSGSYDVYAWWVAAANRATNAPYTINHLDGSTAVARNQSTGGSAWNLLGTFNLNAGTGNSVVLSDNVAGGTYVSADAVRFVYKGTIERVVDNTDTGCVTSGTWSGSSNAGFYGTNSLVRAAGTGSASVTWSPNLPYSGLYKVYGWWVASSNRVDAAAYTINGASGATASPANQKSNGSKWNLIGEVQFNSGTAGNLVLTDAGTAGLYVSADASRFVLVQAGAGSAPTPTPTPSPTATPTPTPTPSPSPSPTPSTTTVVLAVVAAEDGYILETNETAQAGGSLSSAGVDIRLGDDNQDRAMRGVLSFDTSTIPAGATITRATLKLTRASLTGTTPWNTLGTLVADIAVPKLGSTTALEVGDWQAAVTASAVATIPQPSGDGVQVTSNLGATGISNINRTGRTQFKLRFTTEDDDNRANNYVTMASGNHGTSGYRPVLEIEYQN